jgi:GrpB-like predicted nucleotidyltransferase (UPF0157 family)
MNSTAKDDEDEVIMLRMSEMSSSSETVQYPFYMKQPTEKMERLFLKYKEILEETLGESVVSINQMGSGAIPGMPGTHVIDIIVAMKNYPPTGEQLETLKTINIGLAGNGTGKSPHDPNDTWMMAEDFPPQGDFEEFKVDGKFPPEGILGGMVMHLVHYTNPFLIRNLAYVEYLKANEDAFRRYKDVKVQGARLSASKNADDADVRTFEILMKMKKRTIQRYCCSLIIHDRNNGTH